MFPAPTQFMYPFGVYCALAVYQPGASRAQSDIFRGFRFYGKMNLFIIIERTSVLVPHKYGHVFIGAGSIPRFRVQNIFV